MTGKREDSNDADGQTQRGLYRMLGRLSLSLVVVAVMGLGGWLVSVAVAQGVVQTRLQEHDRRLDKNDVTMDRILERLQAISDRVGAPPPAPAAKPGP